MALPGRFRSRAWPSAILAKKNRSRSRLLKQQPGGRTVIEETIGRNDADRRRGEPETSSRPSDWDWSGRSDR